MEKLPRLQNIIKVIRFALEPMMEAAMREWQHRHNMEELLIEEVAIIIGGGSHPLMCKG